MLCDIYWQTRRRSRAPLQECQGSGLRLWVTLTLQYTRGNSNCFESFKIALVHLLFLWDLFLCLSQARSLEEVTVAGNYLWAAAIPLVERDVLTPFKMIFIHFINKYVTQLFSHSFSARHPLKIKHLIHDKSHNFNCNYELSTLVAMHYHMSNGCRTA